MRTMHIRTAVCKPIFLPILKWKGTEISVASCVLSPPIQGNQPQLLNPKLEEKWLSFSSAKAYRLQHCPENAFLPFSVNRTEFWEAYFEKNRSR